MNSNLLSFVGFLIQNVLENVSYKYFYLKNGSTNARIITYFQNPSLAAKSAV